MESIIIDGLKFVEILPLPRGVTTMCVPMITVTKDGSLRFSKALREKLPSRMRALSTEDGSRIAITASDDAQAFVIKKDGTIRAAALLTRLAQAGIQVPCRYEMDQNGDKWVGKLMPALPPEPKPDSAARKPRKRGLADMMPKGGAPS